ncbi:MAG TPA: type II toxin-antitoxin system VapC family toxin [Candidatus Acidoferrales bacterium]|nr:type II toxin-antitoxin system VapC family toxin [Candidatus Acidoferrales bacterium]
MTAFIMDASVAIKWLLPGQGETLTEEALLLQVRYARGQVRLAVPDLFWVEAGNAVWNAVRRGRITRGVGERAVEQLLRYDFTTVGSLSLLEPAFAMATRFGRTVYDCVYVILAVETGAEFITADERLANSLAAYLPVKWLGAL